MFRNFVRPAPANRDNLRDQTGGGEMCGQTVQDSSKTCTDGFQAVSDSETETRCGHSAPRDVRLLQSKSYTKNNLNTKCVFTTSIYVNGKSPVSKVPTNFAPNETQSNQSAASVCTNKSMTSLPASQKQANQNVPNVPTNQILTNVPANQKQANQNVPNVPANQSLTNVPANQKQANQKQTELKKTESSLYSHGTLHHNQHSSTNKHDFVHKRLTDVYAADANQDQNGHSNRPEYENKTGSSKHFTNTDTSSSQTSIIPSTDLKDGTLPELTKSCKTPSRIETKENLTVKEGRETTSEVPVNRRGMYSQTKFNVIPPPPLLAQPVFVGLRDIRNPRSVTEKEIVSVKGTVRGFKNRVRAGIATFWAQSEDTILQQTCQEQARPARNYRKLEQGKIVVYATSMSVVRETSERCKTVRRMLQNHMVRYEERDLYMNRELQQELRQRLTQESISMIHLPHVFADGIHIGGAEELEKLNEAGQLRGLLDNYQKVIVRIMCVKCGGYRFLPCEFCHGSKKSLLRNHFTEEFCALRCMHCDENGLRRCDLCLDQQE